MTREHPAWWAEQARQDFRRARACISEGFCPNCSARLAPDPEVPADGAGGRCPDCGRLAWALLSALAEWAAVDVAP